MKYIRQNQAVNKFSAKPLQTTPLSVEIVDFDVSTESPSGSTTEYQTPNCPINYQEPTRPLIVEQLIGAPSPAPTTTIQ